MKKTLLLVLASFFAVFALAGCAEDSTNDSTNDTPVITVDPALVEQVKKFAEGYYEVTFFYNDGAGYKEYSSDCTLAGDMGLTVPKCEDEYMAGYGQITVDNATGNLSLVTKLQMTGPMMITMSKNYQYNYTEYPVFPITSIDMSDMAQGTVTINADKAIKGVTGRDLTKLTSDADATYTFTFNIQKGEITNHMTVITPINDLNPTTNVIITMKKIQALPTNYTMDKNKLFPSPAPALGGFVANPQ